MKVSVLDIDNDGEDIGGDDDAGHSEPQSWPCCPTLSHKESSALPRNDGNAEQILLTIVHSSQVLNILLILSQWNWSKR